MAEQNAVKPKPLIIYEVHEVGLFDKDGNYDANASKLLYTFTNYDDAESELNYQIEYGGYGPGKLEIIKDNIDYDINCNENYLKTLAHQKKVNEQYQRWCFEDIIVDLIRDFTKNEIGVAKISTELLKIGFSSEQVLAYEENVKPFINNDNWVAMGEFFKKQTPKYGFQLNEKDASFKEYEMEFNKYLIAKELQNKTFENEQNTIPNSDDFERE
ncbi:hypothetical protein [Spiroplasma sp. SV19]|uniref:hypothetical protein n=1 Tax=Spiroplasma sp. SV19 TaxID=2570468 RepID=UPI0024B7154F|nr:hypothetical protein [Spiroplasma sp. SV19]WHQ37067.1 hypothetical protein E7Y35_04115 [Spiroplasma sp. SV19]